MQTDDIKYYIKNFLRNILKIVKDIRKQPNFWKYILLAVVCTFIFLLKTFPYNTMIRNQLQNINNKDIKSLYIGDIDFSLTDSAKIDDASITLNNGSEINLQFSDIDIGIFSALFKKDVKGSAFIQNIKFSQKKMSVNTVLNSEFDLNFESFSQYPSQGDLKLILQNTIADGITIQGFEIPPVRFSSVNADLNLEKNKIRINDIIFTGPDLKGRISGSIELAKFFRQSRLNLNITVDSSSAILENYKILLQSWINDSNQIQLNIKGTVSNPKVNADKTGQTRLSEKNTDPDEIADNRRPPVKRSMIRQDDDIDAREAEILRRKRELDVRKSPRSFRPPPIDELVD